MRQRPQQDWVYNGRRVLIVPSAEIARGFRPHERYGKLVQKLLDGVEPWDLKDDPIETTYDNLLEMPAIVTRNKGRKPVWGIYTRHTARDPKLSPFVHGSGEIEFTRSLTVELTGTPEQPRLTRVYPGEYIPPLPWQASSGDAEGGREMCIHFWRNHSYIYDPSVIKFRKHTNNAPEWYK